MSDIEEDIKRCGKLTEPQNANWIGISNQLAIAGVLTRIQEFEQKVREILDKAELMDYYTLPNVIEDLEKLVEDK